MIKHIMSRLSAVLIFQILLLFACGNGKTILVVLLMPTGQMVTSLINVTPFMIELGLALAGIAGISDCCLCMIGANRPHICILNFN